MVFEPSTAWRVRLPVISYKFLIQEEPISNACVHNGEGMADGDKGVGKSRWRAAISTGTYASHHLL